MQTILGLFHPHLENALVGEILTNKKADLLCPLLILVPSDSLRRRLKLLLVSERQLNLLNLHILTFHQLSLRLFEELHGTSNLALRDDAFLEEALRQIIRMGRPGTSSFSGIEEKIGGCAALWQTLRDLKDGIVEPSRALDALREGYFGQDDSEKMAGLFTLFDTFLSCCKEWGIQDYSDLDILVMEQASSSVFLKQFSHIFYYGFYDLTQVQLDLFRSVTRHYPTTLFFPLVRSTPKHPAWVFAERFYERYLHGLASDSSRVRNLAVDFKQAEGSVNIPILPLFEDEPDRLSEPAPQNLHCTIFSCFGGRDEVVTVAKEILRLSSDEGIAFDQIGVVARSLEPYLPWVREIFSEHRIPITSSAEEPLVQFPLAKAVLLLIGLPLKGYPRSHFIDLVSSPFFNSQPFCPNGITPRPDLWDLLSRRLGISKGIEEWRRLERYADRGLALVESRDDEEPNTITVDAGQVHILWNLFSQLYRDLEALPKEASWSQYASAWKALLGKYLGIAEEGGTGAASREEQVRDGIFKALNGLAGLDLINAKMALAYFIQTYQQWLERSSIPLTDWNAKGVAVLDAMAARGLPFRALFILGLNEGVFPRAIREDAFLRDRERGALETVLGYKVSEKLAAFDEEKLLFTLLVGSARERLYCLYQRSDETGRALAPSWYLSELRRAFGAETNLFLREIIIPRGIVEKAEVQPFSRNDLLLPQELAVQLSLESKDPTALVEICSLSASLYKHGRRAMKHLEATAGRLAEFDGILGPLRDCWDRICKQSVSPTALELYARCPFQFLARNILGLERLERPEEITGLAPSEMGELAHLILKSFYQELIDRGYFKTSGRSVDPLETLKAVVQKSFADYELKNPVGYPVPWETLQEQLTEILKQVVVRDLKELSQSGYRPLALEIELTEELPGNWPSPLRGLSIRGRMDRIDHEPEQNHYRVIDYKFKSGRNPASVDRDLRRSALTGERLQPPFYLLLGKSFAAHQENQENKGSGPTVGAVFYYLAPRWKDGPLSTATFPDDGWEGELGKGLKETVSFLVEGIQQGRFFIQPGDYCNRCEVSEVCRKSHLPTLWRAENDPLTKTHRDLRNKKPEKK